MYPDGSSGFDGLYNRHGLLLCAPFWRGLCVGGAVAVCPEGGNAIRRARARLRCKTHPPIWQQRIYSGAGERGQRGNGSRGSAQPTSRCCAPTSAAPTSASATPAPTACRSPCASRPSKARTASCKNSSPPPCPASHWPKTNRGSKRQKNALESLGEGHQFHSAESSQPARSERP